MVKLMKVRKLQMSWEDFKMSLYEEFRCKSL